MDSLIQHLNDLISATVNKRRLVKQYCSECGEKLAIHKTEVYMYSTRNGKPIFKDTWGCPKNKGWRGIFKEHSHDEAIVLYK